MRDSVSKCAHALVRVGQIVVPLRHGLVERQCPADRLDRLLLPAELQGNDAGVIKALPVPGLERQNRPIEPLGLPEIPGLMLP